MSNENLENFKKALNIDCSGFVERKKTGRKIEKNGVWQEEELAYLSWSVAWEKFKEIYPDAKYSVKKFDNKPFIFDYDTGYIVFTEVEADGLIYEMWLPVMNSNNKAMKSEPYEYTTSKGEVKTVNSATMFDINTTIMRCLTKNLAMFGLGLKIYQGEDIPKTLQSEEIIKKTEKKETKPYICSNCGKEITQAEYGYSQNKYKKPLCRECQKLEK